MITDFFIALILLANFSTVHTGEFKATERNAFEYIIMLFFSEEIICFFGLTGFAEFSCEEFNLISVFFG